MVKKLAAAPKILGKNMMPIQKKDAVESDIEDVSFMETAHDQPYGDVRHNFVEGREGSPREKAEEARYLSNFQYLGRTESGIP